MIEDKKRLGKDITLVAKILGHVSSAIVGGYMGFQSAKDSSNPNEQALYVIPLLISMFSHSVSKMINSIDENPNSPLSESIDGSKEGIAYSALEITLSYGFGYALGNIF